MHRVVIIGGGFAGLHAAQSFKRAEVEVTLIDQRNFHLFQPLLYQVATGALSPGEIAAPLRYLLNRQKNTRVLLGEVCDFDPERREVLLTDTSRVPYDSLIVATGAMHFYFGHPEWAKLAPALKTVEDATEIRTRVLLAFERAEKETDPAARQANLTFVVVGGGPTGVELAGALAEISRDTLKHDFRHVNPADAKIFLIEGEPRLLPPYPPQLSQSAENSLKALGVETQCNSRVTDIDADGVMVKAGDKTNRIHTRTVLWAAGVQASPLGKLLEKRAGAKLDRTGHVLVEPDLSIPGHPEILVAGDLSSLKQQDGKPVPGVAPAAIQQGKYAANLILARLRNEKTKPFRYVDKGSLATIGRNRAVAEIGPLKFSGTLAWLTWVFVHILSIVGFENRVLIAMQWAFGYFTHNRGARLITGKEAIQEDAS